MLQSGAKNSIRGWDDALVSGAGNDVLTGGFGYVFNALNQSGIGNSDLTSRVPPTSLVGTQSTCQHSTQRWGGWRSGLYVHRLGRVHSRRSIANRPEVTIPSFKPTPTPIQAS
jgi:hypothetical protein